MTSLLRTEFAFELIQNHLRESGTLNGPIENYLVQYLQICFYSEMEDCVKKIYSQRLTFDGDEKLSYFVKLTHDKMLGRVKKSDISDMAKHFGSECKEVFNAKLDHKDVSYYSSVISNRHQTSHAIGGTITLDNFEKALLAASRILISLEEAIQ